jgi:hypothetical protein
MRNSYGNSDWKEMVDKATKLAVCLLLINMLHRAFANV